MKNLGLFIRALKPSLKDYFNDNILLLVFLVTSIINTSLLRFFTVKNFFEISPILGDLGVLLVIAALGIFINKKRRYVYYLIFSILITSICIINSTYYSNYLSFVSISLIKTSAQITDVTDAIVKNVFELKDLIFLWQIFAIIFTHKSLTKKESKKISKNMLRNEVKVTFIAGLIVLVIFCSTLSKTAISRLHKQWNREYITMKYGIIIYQINDVISSLNTSLTPFFNYDKSAKEFREYYADNLVSTEKNKYTNVFEGKNLLVIHAESIQEFTMHLSFNGQEVTPNLNKLAQNGLFFSNFYAEESVGTSSDSEFTLNTSLLPSSSGTVFVSYFDREYVSMPKLLKNKGYYTFSMHGNNGTFWNRNVMHKNLGYENYYYYTKDYEIDEVIGLGLSDKSFFRQSIPIIKDIDSKYDNFMGTLIMLSNHTPFTDIENYSDYAVDYKYKYYNEETGVEEERSFSYLEGTKLGSYIKSVHYADEAIGELIEGLDKENLLDNTVIVIYGDHDAKLKRSEFEYFYNYNLETGEVLDITDENYKKVDFYDYELNRKVPFIIWTKDGKYKEKVDKVMGMIDVSPTLGNMFNFKNDYALGHDIFSVSDNIVVFPDGNWLTDKMYYNLQKEEGRILGDDEVISADYINTNNLRAEQMISVSNSIIVHDLIKKENEKIEGE